MMLLEAHAVVQDDLDAAVGNDRFRHAGALTLEDPEAVDDGRQRRRRRVLGVVHEAPSVAEAAAGTNGVTATGVAVA